ncbi:MAG: enoyl-CoA hydratase/isomerase family protein [Bacteroidetes bacterium]|nr:enoyl-CoA hydratase/isomerase family protein [Bacteroidota bacterium]
MDYKHLIVSMDGHIARVTLNRPPVNALNSELVAELVAAAEALRNNDDVWTVAVTSNGKVFCAGADLKERAGIPQENVITFVKGIQSVADAWCSVPQPVLMGINGAALGGGMEFALAGDLLVAGSGAVLGLPETSLGIIPAAGGTQRLAQRTSAGIAKKWILTAQQFTAAEALQDGAVDFVVPSERFDEEFGKIVRKVASNAPLAVRQAKKAIESSYSDWLMDGFENELNYYQPLIPTEDRAEALKAFAGKRTPEWKGR